MLEVRPQGRAKRYMVRAANSAGHQDSRIFELTIFQSERTGPGSQPATPAKARRQAGDYQRSEDNIEQQRNRLLAEKAERAWRNKQSRKRTLLVTLSSVGLIVGLGAWVRWHSGSGVPAVQGSTNNAVAAAGVMVSNALPPGSPTNSSSIEDTARPAASLSTNALNPASIGGTNVPVSLPPPQSPTNEVSGSVPPAPAAAPSPETDVKLSAEPPLPAPWKLATIGSPDATNKAEYKSDGSFLVQGAGKPFTGTDDEHAFVYQAAKCDGEFTVDCPRIPQGAPETGRCGIMLRVSEDPQAPFIFVGIAPKYCLWASRGGQGQTAKEEAKGQLFRRLRLTRHKNQCDAYVAKENSPEWVHLGGVEMEMESNKCLLGLVVASGDSRTSMMASFARAKWHPLGGGGKAAQDKKSNH